METGIASGRKTGIASRRKTGIASRRKPASHTAATGPNVCG